MSAHDYGQLQMCNYRSLFALTVISLLATSVGAQDLSRKSFSSTEELFEFVDKSVCTIIALDDEGNPASQGSGFILKKPQRIVTNAHVIAGFDNAQVKCGDQYASISKIVKYKRGVDIVVAETEQLDIEGLELSEDLAIKPGTEIYAFGSPFGLEGTISPGLASGKRTFGDEEYIQISAPVSPGSSGGPVTDGSGLVVGVTVGSLQAGQNLNFAVPSWTIRGLPSVDTQLEDLRSEEHTERKGPVDRPFQSSDAEIASFRGHQFGTDCAQIRSIELRNPSVSKPVGEWPRSSEDPTGFYLETQLFGKSVSTSFTCDVRFGLIRGNYWFSDSDTAFTANIKDSLVSKYGPGQNVRLTGTEGQKIGCLIIPPNSMLINGIAPTAPFGISWHLGDDLHIDLVYCNGDAGRLTLVYSSLALLQAIQETQIRESLDNL